MKKAYLYFDDVIWLLRDITKKKPKSVFDTPFLSMLKTAHDMYGVKAQLNLFYRTSTFYNYDDFKLSDMTAKYKKEFKKNSDWLKFAFHAYEEFPSYPHANVRYEDTKKLFKMIEKEVFRFAGKDSFAYAVCPHGIPVSKEGVHALKDCGVRLIDCSAGDALEYDPQRDKNIIPHHLQRLLNNRQPEAKIMYYPGSSIPNVCCYNHLTTEVDNRIHNTLETYHDDELDIELKKFSCICLNNVPYEQIPQRVSALIGNEYIGIIDHEQYFYSDYYLYQPDYADKVFTTCQMLHEAGYEFICGEEILDLKK